MNHDAYVQAHTELRDCYEMAAFVANHRRNEALSRLCLAIAAMHRSHAERYAHLAAGATGEANGAR